MYTLVFNVTYPAMQYKRDISTRLSHRRFSGCLIIKLDGGIYWGEAKTLAECEDLNPQAARLSV